MTPEQHAKAIEDAAEQYAYAYSIDDFKDRSKAFDVLQDAIWAGVRVDHSVDANKMVAAPEGWQLVQSTGSTQKCSCAACDKAANHGMRTHMSVCPRCGSKRCEKALNHQAECSSAPKP